MIDIDINVDKNFPICLKFINGKINDKIEFLEYRENNQLIKKKLTDFKNKILYVDHSDFNFKISINNNIKEFEAILKSDTINNVLINLNPDTNRKISDVEILIEDSSYQNSDLMIEYNGKKAGFEI